MAEWTSKTNSDGSTCKDAQCSCVVFWELQQQKSLRRLSNLKPDTKNQYKIILDAEARARRIAAEYARIYLELAENGNKNLRGRYYWMGFGAFASKTVAAIFNHWVSKSGGWIDNKTGFETVTLFKKGNFWLFMEISPWHYAWSENPKIFKDCLAQRDVSKFQNIKTSMDKLEWSKESLNTLKNLRSTPNIKNAFSFLPKIEATFRAKKIEKDKFKSANEFLVKHLDEIAIQEQNNVLQPLVWNKLAMQFGASAQKILGPNATLVLSSDYDVQAVMKKSKIYSDGKPGAAQYQGRHKDVLPTLKEDVYSAPDLMTWAPNYNSRMKWIKNAAKKYNNLMLDDNGRNFLHKELTIISTWKNDNAGKK